MSIPNNAEKYNGKSEFEKNTMKGWYNIYEKINNYIFIRTHFIGP